MSWRLRLLLVAVVLVSLLAGWLHWKRSRPDPRVNTTGAISALRVILSGQSTFHKGDYDGNGEYNYAADYSDLYYIQRSGEEIKLVDKALADADVDLPPGGLPALRSKPPSALPKSGYFFADIPLDASGTPYDYQNECGMCAWPAKYNQEDEYSRYTYVIDITGSVYSKDLGPQTGPLTRYPDVSTWLLIN